MPAGTYLPPQPPPRVVRDQRPPSWWPLALVAALVAVAAIGITVLCLTNPSL